jgi:hypothetical protein
MVLAMSPAGYAHNNGATIVGHSGATGPVCNDCHYGGTAPTVALSGPASLTAGMTAQYTLTVTSNAKATDKIGGVDVAVSNSAALMTPVSTTVQAVAGEIVHKAAIPLSSGVLTVQLSLKAPPTNGTITLYASGLAGDAVDATAGKLSASTKLAINVTGGMAAPVDAGTPSDGGGDMGSPSGSALPNGPGSSGELPPAMSGGCALARGDAAAAAVPPALVMLSLTALGFRRRKPR